MKIIAFSTFANLFLEHELSVTSLGSRANLCVNDRVLKLKASEEINNACKRLKENNAKKLEEGKTSDCCSYYSQPQIESLSNEILVRLLFL